MKRIENPIPAALLVVGLIGATVVAALPLRPRAGTDVESDPARSSFHFVRLEYDSEGGMQEAYYIYEGRLWQRWETDYPQADENFMFRLRELTKLDLAKEPRTVRLTDDELFSFPFLYLCDVGWMRLSEEEIQRLREYLLKGGFLWIDDFWGWAEWTNFERIMRRVLPDVTWQELGNDHPLLRMVFPLEEMPQIPARDFAMGGWTYDAPWIHRYPPHGIEQPHLRGYVADDGRLLAVATLNSDIGDGWEREGYGEWYFEKYSTVAYAMGVNVVSWALTH